MKTKIGQIGKELATILLFGCGLMVLLLLIALVAGLVGGGSIAGAFWRLCAFVGAIILLAAAVLLLTSRSTSKPMKAWKDRFPHVPFTWAVLLTGVWLLLGAVVVNYLIF